MKNMFKRVLLNPRYLAYKIILFPFLTMKKLKEFTSCHDFDSEEIIESNLMEILLYAANNVEYYKNIKIDNRLTAKENLLKFKVISRYDIQNDKPKFISKKDVISIEFNTSGTSGDPLYFYRSAYSGMIDNVHQIMAYKKMGYKRGDRVITINGFNPPKKMVDLGLFWKKKAMFGEMPFGSVQFSSNHLTEKNLINYYDEVMRIKPAFIRGYPSSVYAFFKMIESRGLVFDFKFKAIQLTSENIFDYQVELIEKVANAKVYRQLGHTECAMFAETSGGCDIYHFSPNYGYLEVLDSNGKHVSEGEYGEITVTSFHNLKQPFIRYKTGDRARYIGSHNGKQAIDNIAGREQDYLITRDDQYIPITSIISGSHLSINRFVSLWQIVQIAKGKVIVIIQESDIVPLESLNELSELFMPYASIEFKYVDSIVRSPSGKHKFFVSIAVEN